MRSVSSVVAAGSGVLAASLLSLSQAQTPVRSESSEPAPAQKQELEQVEVTGSRVIYNGNDSPTPLTVVGADELSALQPTTLVDALNELPVFSGSKSQGSNPVAGGIYGGGNPSANLVNLRNLGLTDTLVLMDGQRLVPTLLLGNVDVDMIPDMLIKRVDVVTGGVSAVYGADAVAGVVNYITDKNFNGIKVMAQSGVSSRADDVSYKMGVAGGMSLFDGRVHIEGSFDRYDDYGIAQRTDRPGFAYWGLAGNGSAGNPYTLLNNLRNNNTSFGGLITSGPLKGYSFDSNGIASPFVHGTPTGTATVEVGGDGSYPNTSLVAPEEMNQLFGRLDANVTDTLKGHVQLVVNDKKDYQNSGGFSFLNYKISSTNAFATPEQQAALAAGGSTFTYSKVFSLDEMPAQKSWAEEQQTQLNLGLDGKLGKYNWSVSYNYGRSALYNIQYNNINEQHLSAALDSVINPATGQVTCRVTLTNPGTNPGCVPLNPFGPTAANQSAIDYVTGTTHFTGVFKLYDVNGQISGELFDDWAGPITGALSGEWRRLTFQSSSDSPPTTPIDCTGLIYNCSTNQQLWLTNFSASPLIHQNVSEGALEFDVPLLKDKFLVDALNLNLAGRVASYSTVGTYFPWKVGPEWKVTNDLRLRATISRDISAPPLYELFQPLTVTSQNVQDLLTGRTYTVPSFDQANPGLKPQVADTRTVGFVWQPAGTGFSVTSDYYHITVNHAIIRVNPFQAQYQQACYLSGGSSPYCAQIVRPSYTDTSASNVVTSWISNFVNIATEETWGDDLELNYVGSVQDHQFNMRLLSSYQPHIIYTQPGNDTYDMGGVANGPTPLTASPSLRITAWANVSVTDHLAVGVSERWRNSMKMTGNVTGIYAGNNFVPNRVAPVGYTDLNITYNLGASLPLEFFLHVANLFDKQPPPATYTINQIGPGPGYASSDDPIGRYFTLGVRGKF